MAIFPIRTWGDPVLTMRAEPVTEFDAALKRLVEDMIETMYEAPGVGLAAPQIGVPKRVFVFDAGEGPHAMVNPSVVETSGSWEFDEGCLSVPGKYWTVERPAFSRAVGLDVDGNEVQHAGEELLGRVLQHEMDHLDGRLLLDVLPKRTRRKAMRELREEALGIERSG